jgi:energy-coupling factor transport system substrate-specific component
MSAPTVTVAGLVPAVRLRPRAAAVLAVVSLLGLAAFTWPLIIAPDPSGAAGAHAGDAPWILLGLLPLLLAVLLAEIADGGIDAKAVAVLGVLAAVGAALRVASGGTAGVELVWWLLIPAGRVLGRGFGFVLGAVTLFASALLTSGIGPWLPFQMLGAAWVGFGAGCLPRASGRVELAMLAAYGAVAGLMYGLLLDLYFWPFLAGGTQLDYVAGAPVLDNLGRFLAFHLATAMGFDVGRAITTVVLLLLVGRPVLLALRRAARRASFEAG